MEPVSRGKWAVSTGNEGTVGRPGVMFWGPEDDIMYAPAQEFHTSTREGGAVKFRGASPWNRLVIGCCYFHIVYGQVAGGHIVVKAAGSATITDIIAVVGPKPEVGHMTQVLGWGQLMCGEIVGRGRLLPLAATARYLRDRPTVTTTENSETDTTVSLLLLQILSHMLSQSFLL